MLELSGRNNKQSDGLFLERLDTFMAKCLADIRAFSEREQRPFEETRQYVAEWHAKYLFQPRSSTTTATTADMTFPTTTNTDTINVATHWQTRSDRIHSILCEASRVLESLYETSGIQSFLLAVDPPNPADNGFLGGSLLGREFWRSMRGGGKAGAKSFRVYCLKEMAPPAPLNQPLSIADATVPAIDSASSSSAPVPARRGVTAKSLKTELYDKFRKTLRRVSGVRNAEMKWTSPDRLDVYGVQLVGWPSDIPAQNPSTLKQGQNKRLMEALESGMIRFEKIGGNRRTESPHETPSVEENVQQVNIEPEDDFSWALDTDAGNVHEPSGTVSLSSHPNTMQSREGSMPGIALPERESIYNFPGPSPREDGDYDYSGYLDSLMTCGVSASELYLDSDDMQLPPVKRVRTEEPEP